MPDPNFPPAKHRAALVGSGTSGSLSPALHGREAAALGLDYRHSLLDLDALTKD